MADLETKTLKYPFPLTHSFESEAKFAQIQPSFFQEPITEFLLF